jgi:hypothetical protein
LEPIMKRYHLTAGVLALALTACAEDPTGVSANELVLAQESQVLAENVTAATHAHYAGWLARLLDTLRTTDNPEARAFLEQSRAYRDSALAAWRAGDRDEARRYHELAFRSLLSAVIVIYPNAPARTGEALDSAIARIERHLGDREAPRIRRILAHVKVLRQEAIDSGDPVTELALNLRGLQILHRLVHHLRFVRDHDRDRVADDEMHAVGY